MLRGNLQLEPPEARRRRRTLLLMQPAQIQSANRGIKASSVSVRLVGDGQRTVCALDSAQAHHPTSTGTMPTEYMGGLMAASQSCRRSSGVSCSPRPLELGKWLLSNSPLDNTSCVKSSGSSSCTAGRGSARCEELGSSTIASEPAGPPSPRRAGAACAPRRRPPAARPEYAATMCAGLGPCTSGHDAGRERVVRMLGSLRVLNLSPPVEQSNGQCYVWEYVS
jgi:hypothetical protein